MGKFGRKVACKYDRQVLCIRLDGGQDCIRHMDNYGERRSYCKLLPESERKRFMDEKYKRCQYDNLPCKKTRNADDFPPCITYDINGRLKSVCKRFVAPAGFSDPKQLSSEDMKESN